uniref:Uncharacterized protein n=1 Tax=Anguilla anguilla TaxID=7936 RepID=A0A0E9VKK0_ANGAN
MPGMTNIIAKGPMWVQVFCFRLTLRHRILHVKVFV